MKNKTTIGKIIALTASIFWIILGLLGVEPWIWILGLWMTMTALILEFTPEIRAWTEGGC